MTCLKGLLETTGRALEVRLASQLNGLFGGIIRGYLPQVWVFQTEEGTVSLTVDGNGKSSVSDGAKAGADVTVATTHARLSAALSTRNPAKVPAGPLSVTPHTEKGRTAFQLLRSRIGL